MAQYARPSSDVDMSGWTCSTGTNRAALIDESVANDDTDYISRVANASVPTDSTVNLSSVTNPGTQIGHVIRARARLESAGSVSLQCSLSIGGSVIVSNSFTVTSTSYADFAYTLTAGQVAAITNYGALQFYILASGGSAITMRVTQAYFEVPDVGSDRQRMRRGMGR